MFQIGALNYFPEVPVSLLPEEQRWKVWKRHPTWREIRWIPKQWSPHSVFSWCRIFFTEVSQKLVT